MTMCDNLNNSVVIGSSGCHFRKNTSGFRKRVMFAMELGNVWQCHQIQFPLGATHVVPERKHCSQYLRDLRWTYPLSSVTAQMQQMLLDCRFPLSRDV